MIIPRNRPAVGLEVPRRILLTEKRGIGYDSVVFTKSKEMHEDEGENVGDRWEVHVVQLLELGAGGLDV